MLIESLAHLPSSLAMLQDVFHAPNSEALARIFLRWSHFVAGITWIGILYFFNLVNVNFMKALDAPTKGKVIPELMPRALWFFRWGAVVTVLVGLTYYAMYILSPDTANANNPGLGGMNVNVWLVLIVWLLFPVVTFAIEFFIIQKSGINDGRVLAVIIAVLVIAMSAGIVWWLTSQFTAANGENWASNKAYSIGIGGALGVIMLLNVWGIIWPAQKRIIAWTKDNAQNGTPIPPESAALGRKGFLASRANAWLSLPMLFFMGTSHGDYIMFGK
ncbi:MAG TPA: urate hydroxylase PuuD [Pyrinomonadaceae bacterium]|nr:urate hydroxylase PuuD [Pyrinomonadaceae bacterium]